MPTATEQEVPQPAHEAAIRRLQLPSLRALANLPGWLPSVAPAALTFASCMYKLGNRQPWRDELSTWWAAHLSLLDLARLLDQLDAVLGLYYFFMHGWIALFGDSVFALRLPSALLMTLSAWLIQRLATRQFGTRAGLLSGIAFAIIPSVTAFGQEARPYALAVSATVLSTLALLRAREQASVTKRWVVYAASIVLLGFSHLVALCLLFGHAALMAPEILPKRSTPSGRRWVLTVAAATLLLVPLFALAAGQSHAISWIRADWRHIRALPEDLFYSSLIAGAFIALGLLGLAKTGPLARLFGV